jgi:two-component system chemotaxis sensor kinase CheA
MVDVLLQSGDALRSQLAGHQGAGGEPVDTSDLLASFRAFVAGEGVPAPAAAASPPVVAAAPAAEPAPAPTTSPSLTAEGLRVLELTLGPLPNPELAASVVELFKEIEGLGSIEAVDGGMAQDGLRRFKVTTASSDNDLLDLFSFHVSREQAAFLPWGGENVAPGYGFFKDNPGAPTETPAPVENYGFFAGAPGAPGAPPATQAAPAPHTPAAVPASVAEVVSPPKPPPNRPDKAPAATLEAATVRVSIEKVDQLINLMGELVITQAMLAQNGRALDPALHQGLVAGLTALDRNTRDLQEAVMMIRMIPMGSVFSRFPRMLRDLAAKLGKQVDFVTQGEATELDKGLVEKITDPLTHLVRNSCDHGIESPAERLAKGKPETGTITLSASHQGGSIVIEVKDDGKGLSRDKLLKKARERGIAAPDSMPDSEVWALIFAPGFSTAEVVTDVSGRGVGMDVVKKNITSLGGTVEIDSAEGFGMRVAVRLPLTLAIMDGMSVGVGGEVYILPLSSVIESFQVEGDSVRTIGGNGRVVEVRDEYMPVLDLDRVFQVPRKAEAPAQGIMVVAEADGSRVALLVDELLGQQQVVVKNLEANYRKVQDISGATIMGDGRVALILDVGSLVRRARH